MHWQCLKGGNNDVPTNLPSRVENGNRERKEGEPCHGHLFNLPERRGVATSALASGSFSDLGRPDLEKPPPFSRSFSTVPHGFPRRRPPPGFSVSQPHRGQKPPGSARFAVRGAGSLLGLGNRRSLRRQAYFWLRSLGGVWSLLPSALSHDTNYALR